ncbi:MAG: hypothetical protein M3376_04695 [Actinomycetota bacterium]|nr:hypothetical protein [Actinomycetota bacterium]
MLRSLLTSLVAAAVLAFPATSFAARLVAPDPTAEQVTALDGTIVWVTGEFGHQRLVQRAPDGTISAVTGTRQARDYRAVDLGRDSDGKLRLTYLRCDAAGPCQALWNDLDGRRASFRILALPGCQVDTAPAQWRTRIAYGLYCTGSANRKNSGLYVKRGSRKPVRLPRPKDAVKFAITNIADVDLRSNRVAAVAADIYEYSFSQTVAAKDMWSAFVAASEGDSDAHVRGIALGRANVHWTLTNAIHVGDPGEAIIFRQQGACLQRERLVSAPGAEGFVATGLAVDENTMYLIVPGMGIVTHTFTPDPTLTCD